MKELLEQSNYFLLLRDNMPPISLAIFVISTLVLVFILIKKSNESPMYMPQHGTIYAVSLILIFISFPFSIGIITIAYGENILDSKYEKELNEHISYLKENNEINSIDYRYSFMNLPKDDYKIIINVDLKKNKNEFNKENPSLSESLKKDIEYNLNIVHKD